MSFRHAPRRGFTITELLVVIAMIVVLLGLLLPALGGVWQTSQMTKSMNHLRQIGNWMRDYSNANRDIILPSRFDYSDPSKHSYQGKARSDPNPAIGRQHEGTWTDILWTVYEINPFPTAAPDAGGPSGGPSYRFDSPDRGFYDEIGPWSDNPLRSAAMNSRNTPDGVSSDLPKPWGSGAVEEGYPGYFAANNFFDARPDPDDPTDAGTWFTNGQIRAPSRSLYLVDSFAGETIGDDPPDGFLQAFDVAGDTAEVDFRYNDSCLMLFLDGHIDQQGPWRDLQALQDNRRVKVLGLTEN